MNPKSILFALTLMSGLPTLAQTKIIRLYDGPAPGSESWTHKEAENNANLWNTRVVYNVTDPTLTVFQPTAGTANGTAVVICPGGGFQALSIDSEGFDVAKYLTGRGVTCFVLKYRLVESKTTDPAREIMAAGAGHEAKAKAVIPLAQADGLKAMAYVRQHAAEYGLDPKRIGIMGFSAGGTVTGSVAFNYTPDTRPDFVAPIYLQYEWVPGKGNLPADAPPAFILAATDDQLGLAPHSVKLYTDWVAAKKPAELHLYSKGGHGFGMRTQNLPSDRWIALFADWLDAQGFLKKLN